MQDPIRIHALEPALAPRLDSIRLLLDLRVRDRRGVEVPGARLTIISLAGMALIGARCRPE